MNLFINTSKENQLGVFLIEKNKVVDKIFLKGDYKVSENLLKIIVKILKKNKVKFEQLEGIFTVAGPGPFTSIRISTAIANTLSYSLQIPVAGLEIKRKKWTQREIVNEGLKQLANATAKEYIKPYYDKEPNIT